MKGGRKILDTFFFPSPNLFSRPASLPPSLVSKKVGVNFRHLFWRRRRRARRVGRADRKPLELASTARAPEPSGSTVLGAWRASTARAARGRAVCVMPLGASAWLCAERVGERGALTRAHARTHGHPVGHARAALSRALAPVCTQHTLPGGATCCPRSVLWQMLVSLATRWGASQLRPAWASAGCTRAWRRQRTPHSLTFPCRRLAGSAASCDPRSLHCPGSRAWRRQRTPDPFTFPCCRLAGSAASCDPRTMHCPGSATAFARRQARGAGHGSTRWSSGRL